MVSVGITQRFAPAKVASDFASLSLQRQYYGSRGAVTESCPLSAVCFMELAISSSLLDRGPRLLTFGTFRLEFPTDQAPFLLSSSRYFGKIPINGVRATSRSVSLPAQGSRFNHNRIEFFSKSPSRQGEVAVAVAAVVDEEKEGTLLPALPQHRQVPREPKEGFYFPRHPSTGALARGSGPPPHDCWCGKEPWFAPWESVSSSNGRPALVALPATIAPPWTAKRGAGWAKGLLCG
ncbi:uncharacterized protein TRUGW13939_02830 [Talaromyces rugulosus]|uniref:Uncharacterized protein n=1 Tax=Talaromyces rugulosus TaxID=121627 RepID=A0A7H8QPA3_TALRU|nr:uncharacterized protein TRUGW13939_02830 [Talaromyces rugulosus]QKX55732.1 hypothetical protein TRUGW13939_02830 [Talaromyces rugulosus]